MPKYNPDPIGSPSFRRQFPLRPEDLRRIAEQAAASQRDAGTGDHNDTGSGVGNQVGPDLMPDAQGFWARIYQPPVNTTNGPALYSWVEVQDDGSGSAWQPGSPTNRGLFNAMEINNNLGVPIPGPPLNLAGALPGTIFWYFVTATWTNLKTGVAYQSGESNEVSAVSFSTLTWLLPEPIDGFVLSGFQIWRGTSSYGENTLVATVSASTTTYTDVGSGTLKLPVPGGATGPIVWMSPRSAWDYYKFSWQSQSSAFAYVQPTNTSSQSIIIGRTITDAVLSGTTLTSPKQANFTQQDVGAVLVGTGITGGTTIASVTSATTAVMSASATSGTGVTVKIETGTVKGYAAVINYQDGYTGVWKRRAITDGVLNGTSTLSSPNQAAFTSADVGAAVTGHNIPANTTIASVTNGTTAVMSNSAGASASSVLVTIQQESLPAVWLEQINDSILIGGAASTVIPVYLTNNYQCRFFATDVNSVPIFATGQEKNISYLQSNLGTASLSTSWGNPGLAVTLPAETTWMLTAQITGSITSSATGAGDSLSFRFYDSTNATQYGVVADTCDAVCASLTYKDTVTINAIVAVGLDTITVNAQGIINTSTASTGSVVRANITAVRLP